MSLWNTMEILSYKEVTSTNTVARDYAHQYPDGPPALIIADKQTAGRGRYERSFYSTLEQGLYASILLRHLPDQVVDLTHYTIITAAIVANVLEDFIQDHIQIKWVNDLIYRGKKVGGILCEAVSGSRRQLIIGIGLNLFGHFDMADHTTQQVAGTLFDERVPMNFPLVLMERIIQQFQSIYDQNPATPDWFAVYEQHLFGRGQSISFLYKGEEQNGQILGINANGQLRVRLDSGEEKALLNEEISLRSFNVLP